ncbi:MAG: ribonuclease HI [Lachnospiraceae bacterium]|nr:ribonuclease HI [Lachnospiraceae bacterium]
MTAAGNNPAKKVIIYTDGSSRGNPGPGGYGAVLLFTDSKGETHRKEISAGYRMTTNNRMELMAVISALNELLVPCDVDLYSDSKYIVDAVNEHWIDKWMKNGWKRNRKDPVANPDLWKLLLSAMNDHQVSFHWVKGHDGVAQNEVCDRLAVAAAEGSELLEDTGYTEAS